ncbi:MAG: hypothetical protein JWP87_5806, partial [Labilithrix sp.]|nr:hypothetical protein [Labilithrix sp.]
MQRVVVLLAFAGCARAAHSAPAEPPVEPFDVGRSPPPVASADARDDNSVGAVNDAGAVALVASDAAFRSAGCALRAIGHNGAPSANYACAIEQEYDKHAGDAGLPFLGIWDAPPLFNDPKIYIGIFRSGVPVVGKQAPGAFSGAAYITLGGADKWKAAASDFSTVAIGSFAVSVTSVRAIRAAGATAYELHGYVDAQLIPTVEGNGVGW